VFVKHDKLISIIIEIDAMVYGIEEARTWINIRTCAQPISKRLLYVTSCIPCIQEPKYPFRCLKVAKHYFRIASDCYADSVAFSGPLPISL
jgi:hypothetical protein